jgi:hypothetical protein
MATYKEIRGTTIQVVDSAPSQLGEIFYDSSARAMKAVNLGSAAWATANNASTARYGVSGNGLQTAQLVCGGESPPGSPNINVATEEYDGTNWTNGGNLPAGKRNASSFGTQTSAVNAAGLTSNPGTVLNSSEEYDGSSWTSGGNVTTARRNLGSSGVLTAGVIFGGYAPPGRTTATEEYDGSSWTSGGALSTAVSHQVPAVNGTQTATFSASGISTAITQQTEEYNGSSWTSGGNVITGREQAMGGGTLTAGLLFGGNAPPGNLTSTEGYDGTSWSAAGNLNAARGTGGGGGTQTASILSFGTPGPGIATEEYTGAAPTTVSIDTD